MLISAKSLNGTPVHAGNERVGRVKDTMFDDEQWVVRYVVVKSGFWVFGRSHLISPMSIDHAVPDADYIATSLNKEQIRNAPPVDVDRPVSRRMEEQFHNYYRIPVYWGGVGLWAGSMTPLEAGLPGYEAQSKSEIVAQIDEQYHLRSTKEVVGYRVMAEGQDIGSVGDLLLEDSTFAIRYLRIASKREYGDGILYVSPQWVTDTSWAGRKIDLDISLDSILDVPPVGRTFRLTLEEEIILHDHFKRPRYWA